MIKIKNIFVFCFIFLFTCPLYSQTKKLSQDEAYKLIVTNVLNNSVDKINILASKNTYFQGDKIEKISNETTLVPFQECWYFFIDDHPFANWSHDCRFVFVNAYTGEIKIINEKNPPKNLQDMDEKAIMKVQINQANLFNPKNYTNQMPSNSPVNNYAVIISGGANAYNNWIRYWNDCAAIYTTLVNVYGFRDDHIYVLMSDGTSSGADRHQYDGSYDSSPLDLDSDGDNDILYSATKANITSVFNTLSGILTQNDFLFVFSTDHGGQESGQNAYLNLWNETMRDDEFAIEVNKVNVGQTSVVMEQCFSGGFVDDLASSNRVIATACRYDESSWAMPPDYNYNEFVYHWTAAVAGHTPEGTTVNADANADGKISMQEAFTYAQSHDTQSEQPQYNSQPTSLGTTLSLAGLTNCPADLNITSNITGGTYTYLASNSIIASNTISGSVNVTYGANNSVRLLSGFKVGSGCKFSANRNGCSSLLKSAAIYNSPEYSKGKNEDNLNQSKVIDIENPVSDYDVTIYPNPTSGFITIKLNNLPDQKTDIQLVDMNGTMITSISTSEKEISFDLKGYPSGSYIVKVICNNNVMIKRILKQ